jgi:predicted metal-binding membrane protein
MTLAAAPTREMRIRARDRWVIIAGLVGVTGAAWVYLFTMGRGMAAGMSGASMGAMGSMAGRAHGVDFSYRFGALREAVARGDGVMAAAIAFGR